MDLKAIQNSMKIGSQSYQKVAAQVEEFLRFNGYEETLRAMSKEQEKVLAEKRGDEEERATSAASETSKPSPDVSKLFKLNHFARAK